MTSGRKRRPPRHDSAPDPPASPRWPRSARMLQQHLVAALLQRDVVVVRHPVVARGPRKPSASSRSAQMIADEAGRAGDERAPRGRIQAHFSPSRSRTSGARRSAPRGTGTGRAGTRRSRSSPRRRSTSSARRSRCPPPAPRTAPSAAASGSSSPRPAWEGTRSSPRPGRTAPAGARARGSPRRFRRRWWS